MASLNAMYDILRSSGQRATMQGRFYHGPFSAASLALREMTRRCRVVIEAVLRSSPAHYRSWLGMQAWIDPKVVFLVITEELPMQDWDGIAEEIHEGLLELDDRPALHFVAMRAKTAMSDISGVSMDVHGSYVLRHDEGDVVSFDRVLGPRNGRPDQALAPRGPPLLTDAPTGQLLEAMLF